MNLNILLVPKDMNYVPSEVAVREISEYLTEEVQDYVEFAEAGIAPRLWYMDEGDSYLPTIGCPMCKARIATEGQHAVWAQDLRERLLANRELDLNTHRVSMPCCGKEAPVVALDFGGRAGFGRFSISLEGADIEEQEEAIVRKAEEILDCQLVKIEFLST